MCSEGLWGQGALLLGAPGTPVSLALQPEREGASEPVEWFAGHLDGKEPGGSCDPGAVASRSAGLLGSLGMPHLSGAHPGAGEVDRQILAMPPLTAFILPVGTQRLSCRIWLWCVMLAPTYQQWQVPPRLCVAGDRSCPPAPESPPDLHWSHSHPCPP